MANGLRSIEAFAAGMLTLGISIEVEVEVVLAHVFTPRASTPKASTPSVSTPSVSGIASAMSLALA